MNNDPSIEEVASVARLLRVLADPMRLALLHELRKLPAFVAELVARTNLTQPAVSKQLNILYDAGLVARQRHGTQIRYSIGQPVVFELWRLACRMLGEQARDAARLFADTSVQL